MKIICNGELRELDGSWTVERLLAELGMEARHVAVEVNLELVPRARHAERRLVDGDRLEIVSLVGGG
jgi:thiamine biosynthesis protein ThiS